MGAKHFARKGAQPRHNVDNVRNVAHIRHTAVVVVAFLWAAARQAGTLPCAAAQDVTEMSGSEGSNQQDDAAYWSSEGNGRLTEWFATASWFNGSFGEDGAELPPINPAEIQPRIVGGRAVSGQESYPYVVLLLHDDKIKCAGSLIGPKLVLSAGHCAGAGTVFVQGHDSDGDMGFHRYTVRREARHPSFESPEYDYDVTVLMLWESPGVETVALDDGDIGRALESGDSLTIMGWGATSESGDPPRQLHIATIPYVRQDFCENRYQGYITDRMMCFGGGEVDACQGDSGGPLVQRGSGGAHSSGGSSNDGTDVQVGIISWGVGCARRGYPGVYTRVHIVAAWVRSVAKAWGEELASSSSSSTPSISTSRNEEEWHERPGLPQSTVMPAQESPRLCPPSGEWHAVEWTLHAPYDLALWEQHGLKQAVRDVLARHLVRSKEYPGLIREEELVVSDESIAAWGKDVPSCPGPSLAAKYLIHFSEEDIAKRFQQWVRSADSVLLPPIYDAVPELCGARTSTSSSVQRKRYCIITLETGKFAYSDSEGDSSASASSDSSD